MADPWGGSWGSAWGSSWGSDGSPPEPTPEPARGGGWLTKEQAAAQLREIRRQERQETERREAIKARARELEETIEEAYARATGKKRTARALEGTEKPKGAPPEQLVTIAQDVAERLSGALQGSGKRYSRDRELLARIEGAIAEMDRLMEAETARIAEDDEAAALLLMTVM